LNPGGQDQDKTDFEPMNAQAYANNLKDEKRERMLRKLMIMEHKRDTGDVIFLIFSKKNNSFLVG